LAQNLSYTATILGQKVPVTISGGTADDRTAVRGRLDAAVADINQHADQLTPFEVKVIHNVKSITSNDWEESGAYPQGRVYLNFADVMKVLTAFLATDILT
jgi:hypothetical protein